MARRTLESAARHKRGTGHPVQPWGTKKNPAGIVEHRQGGAPETNEGLADKHINQVRGKLRLFSPLSTSFPYPKGVPPGVS